MTARATVQRGANQAAAASNKRASAALLACILVVTSLACGSGCHALSEAAYSTGRLLDPSYQRPSYESCESLVATQMPQPYPGTNVAQGPCQACQSKSMPEAEFNVQAEVQGLQVQTTALQQTMGSVELELAQRNDALADTRAELARVQRDMGELGKVVSNWQYQLNHMRERMQARDRKRLSELQQMTAMVEQMFTSEVVPAAPPGTVTAELPVLAR